MWAEPRGVITNRGPRVAAGAPHGHIAGMTRSLAALRNLSRVRLADARKARDDGAAARARAAEIRRKAEKAVDSAMGEHKGGGSLSGDACR